MRGEQLRDAILALIESHPGLSASPAGRDTTHALRFVTRDGAPLAIEPDRKAFQNLWVRADSVNLRRLRGIEPVHYDHRTFDESRPNHNLFGEAGFKDADLIRFRINDLWQAARVIAELAGMEGSP